jgi:hypothetical protein
MEFPMTSNLTAALILALVIAGGSTAAVAHPGADAPPAKESLQGDQSSWINNPHMHAFYDLTVAAFAHGVAKVDRARFEADAHRIFRDFAVSRHMNPEDMLDHLKLIPGQVVQIATDDPRTLASYDNFVAAVFGPQ